MSIFSYYLLNFDVDILIFGSEFDVFLIVFVLEGLIVFPVVLSQ